MYHSRFQKPKLKNRSNIIKGVGCRWFYHNEQHSSGVVNIALDDAVQLLTFYWTDEEERDVVPLEHIILPHEQIAEDRLLIRIRMTAPSAIHRVELCFPTEDSRNRFISYITPYSSDSGHSSASLE